MNVGWSFAVFYLDHVGRFDVSLVLQNASSTPCLQGSEVSRCCFVGISWFCFWLSGSLRWHLLFLLSACVLTLLLFVPVVSLVSCRLVVVKYSFVCCLTVLLIIMFLFLLLNSTSNILRVWLFKDSCSPLSCLRIVMSVHLFLHSCLNVFVYCPLLFSVPFLAVVVLVCQMGTLELGAGFPTQRPPANPPI